MSKWPSTQSLLYTLVSIIILPGCISGKTTGAVTTSQSNITAKAPGDKLEPNLRAMVDKIAVIRSIAILGTNQNVSVLSTPRVKVDNYGNLQCNIYLDAWSEDHILALQKYAEQIQTRQEELLLVRGWFPANNLGEIANFEFVTRIAPPDYSQNPHE